MFSAAIFAAASTPPAPATFRWRSWFENKGSAVIRVSRRRLGAIPVKSVVPIIHPWRSTTNCTETLVDRQMPPADNLTTTAFAAVLPGVKLSAEVSGTPSTHGQAFTQPFAVASVAATLRTTLDASAFGAAGKISV